MKKQLGNTVRVRLRTCSYFFNFKKSAKNLVFKALKGKYVCFWNLYKSKKTWASLDPDTYCSLRRASLSMGLRGDYLYVKWYVKFYGETYDFKILKRNLWFQTIYMECYWKFIENFRNSPYHTILLLRQWSTH